MHRPNSVPGSSFDGIARDWMKCLQYSTIWVWILSQKFWPALYLLLSFFNQIWSGGNYELSFFRNYIMSRVLLSRTSNCEIIFWNPMFAFTFTFMLQFHSSHSLYPGVEAPPPLPALEKTILSFNIKLQFPQIVFYCHFFKTRQAGKGMVVWYTRRIFSYWLVIWTSAKFNFWKKVVQW